MARVNVYLPDDLAARAREAGLNVSALTQDALQVALRANQTREWLARVRSRNRPSAAMTEDELMEIMDEVREESGRAGDALLGEPGRTCR